jgi:hypothetical protein
MIALVVMIFLFIRNNKDRKKIEKQMNKDYKKPVERKDERDTEEGDA